MSENTTQQILNLIVAMCPLLGHPEYECYYNRMNYLANNPADVTDDELLAIVEFLNEINDSDDEIKTIFESDYDIIYNAVVDIAAELTEKGETRHLVYMDRINARPNYTELHYLIILLRNIAAKDCS